MAYWDKKRPAEIVLALYAREKSTFRLQHIENRLEDQPVASLRKAKRNGRR
jgi:hypothetical protein